MAKLSHYSSHMILSMVTPWYLMVLFDFVKTDMYISAQQYNKQDDDILPSLSLGAARRTFAVLEGSVTTSSVHTGKAIRIPHLFNQFIAFFHLECSVLERRRSTMMNLQPLLIGWLWDVHHSKTQCAESCKNAQKLIHKLLLDVLILNMFPSSKKKNPFLLIFLKKKAIICF